ncbi:xylose isomerase domain protein TIM barrel [Lachnospiraceae bacterium KM106-2]|nr:xylose isomerase domain protein TIM barrel [Lachnospiraceae bacterium KM106-2]
MEFGMPTLIECHSLEENAILAKKLGLSFLELNMNLPEYQIGNMDLDHFQEIQRKYGIYYTLHLDENLNISDFNELVATAYLKTVQQAIAVSRRLNIPILNMHLSEGVYFTLPDHKEYLFQQYQDVYLAQMRRLKEKVSEWIGDDPILICIENSDGFHPFHKEAISLLLESPHFGMTLDIGHDAIAKQSDLEYILQTQRLRHIHLHDFNDRSCHLPLGTGNVDVNKMLSLAKSYGTRVVLETKTISGLKESVEYVRKQV